EVVDGAEDITTVSRLNGLNGIGLRIKKQSDANAVDMAKLTKVKFKEIEEKYKDKGIHFTVATDTSKPTIDSVNAVLHDLEIAILLVAA
ncbi:MAG TPA: efflux RND transporter permease subunit, partial [Fluviicola sp.]|nr:efflux RND transporter permease subunit [Fluviicola sp.]